MSLISIEENNLGKGLILKNNKLDINNFQDYVWSGKHIFSKPIIFAQDQYFPLDKISHDNCTIGSVIVSTGQSWQALPPGSPGQVLTFTSKGAKWLNVTLDQAEGTLSKNHGGTGWADFPVQGLLCNTAKSVVDIIPFTLNKKILFSENNEVFWQDYQDIADDVAKRFPKVFSIKSNKAILEKQNPGILLQDINQVDLSLVNNKNFIISLNSPAENKINKIINFSLDQSTFEIKVNDNVVFSIDDKGFIQKGSLGINNINGIVPLQQGGTGLDSYDPGDLLYVSENGTFSRLSTKNAEGCFLRIIGGMPKYVYFEKTGFDGVFESPVTFAKSSTQASITIRPNELISNPVLGSLEFDGNQLYITNKIDRKKFAYIDSDINGNSQNVNGVVDLSHGGTNTNLEALNEGQMIVKSNDFKFEPLEQGNEGQVLSSRGHGLVPEWIDPVASVTSGEGSGIKINKNNFNFDLSFDSSLDYVWLGENTIKNKLILESQAKFFIKREAASQEAPINIQSSKTPAKLIDGDIWYDGSNLNLFANGQKINLSSSSDVNPHYYLTLAAGSEAIEGRKIRMKTPIPPLVGRGTAITAKWRLRKLDILFDEIPSDNVSINLWSNNNKILLSNGIIPQNVEKFTFESFEEAFVETNEILQLECIKSGGSNYWSAFLLVELI